jgi:hypothetical protein
MSYNLRTDKGTLFGRVDNNLAGKILKDCKGHWVEKKFVSGVVKNVFVFTEDMTYGTDVMKVFLFEGFYMEEM